MATHDINAICSQILTADDLVVEEELFKQVLEKRVVTKTKGGTVRGKKRKR